MFLTRLISGIVLIAAALVCLIVGGPLLFCVLLALSLIGMHELYKAAGVEKEGRVTLLSAAGYLGAVIYYGTLPAGNANVILPALMLGLILIMAVYVFSYPKYTSEPVMTAFFGLVYVAVMLSFIYQTRNLPDGIFTVWLIFICSWGSDTCAYCVGMLIGKHKMAPRLSPKKSIEGAVGGVAGAAAIGAIYAALISGHMSSAANVIPAYALIGAVGALISMVGDLAASAIKRNHDIKDYGHLIPGHGGVLDRFDSVIFISPVIYLMALLILH